MIAHVETRFIASDPQIASDAPIASLSNQNNSKHQSKNPGGITGNKNPMFHENISRVIRWYKGRTTFEIRKIYPDFVWQTRFHDHIIRNEESFQRIRNYIVNNPENWKDDKFYS